MIREVQKAILESEIPRFLYMIEEEAARATKGNPIANQVLGIQVMGCLFLGGCFSTQSYVGDQRK
jgi:hypothetical protein